MDSNKPLFGSAARPTDKTAGAVTDAATKGDDGLKCATGDENAAKIAVKPTEETAAVFKCLTQPREHTATKDMSHEDRFRIFVGFNNECPRYTPGSVIKYISYFQGWPGGQGQMISDTTWAAASVWNSQNLGVTFQWTTNPAEATFEVVYGGANPGFVAMAFFPNGQKGNKLYVYEASFTPQGLNRMQNSLEHELGHIMGLRHEFADTETPAAVLVGPRNDLSIMSYAANRSIQSTDIKWTRYFYALRNGTTISDGQHSFPVHDYSP
jgi:hypothetical protein